MLQTLRNSSCLKLALSGLSSVLAAGSSGLWLCESSLRAADGVRVRDKYGVESKVRTGEI